MKSGSSPNFDRIARPYRWLEYLTFGPLLERCRFHRLPELSHVRKALILGDGDGRFTARLLAANPEVQVDVVDISPAMLKLLESRATTLGSGAAERLTTHCVDARNWTPPGNDYDLVVTHFFLDCFTGKELSEMANRIQSRLSHQALWMISEFNVPAHGSSAVFSRLVVKSLYWAFRLLTGLRIQALPDYRIVLQQSGMELSQTRSWLGDLLVSELWQAKLTIR